MSYHYPRIRIDAGFGNLMVREGLSLTFYLRRTHAEVAECVLQSLHLYLDAVGPEALGWYYDQEGDWQRLDSVAWERIQRELRESAWPIVQLLDAPENGNAYRFEYFGKDLAKGHAWRDTRDATCAVSFWLPTEFLEQHGPAHVRELALTLAAPLPFSSGYVGLSFNGELDVVGVGREVTPLCLRYPGIDVPDLSELGWALGTRFRGPAWLNFVGQPLLGELGGPAALRSRLQTPGTTVQDMGGDRACVTLGEWPEAGDSQRGDTLPAYRELARVMAPWLYRTSSTSLPCLSEEEARRWENRFLD